MGQVSNMAFNKGSQLNKALITGGCSFSDDHWALHTWNTYLDDMYDDVYHTGKDGAGNQFISRLVTKKLLDVRDVLPYSLRLDVVVLYSGLSRKCYVTNNSQHLNQNIMIDEAKRETQRLQTNEPDAYQEAKRMGDIDIVIESNAGQHNDLDGNIIEPEKFAYSFFVPAIKDNTLEDYYGKYTNTIDDWEKTSVDILNLQELCKANNANFFWGHYDSHYQEVYTNRVKPLYNHIAWAHDRLDHSKCFCPEGMSTWVDNNFTQEVGYLTDDWHPSERAHKVFTKSIIKPFIQNFK